MVRIGKKKRRRPKNIKNINELESALQEEWNNITDDVLIKLIEHAKED